MKFKHTPGPWVLLPEEVDKSYIRVRGTIPGSRYKIANVVTPTYDGAYEWEAQETRANAHLIAAAPELLEALTLMLETMKSGMVDFNAHDEYVMNKAEYAVTKAFGIAQ